METFWFTIVAIMLAMYVVFDGFDLGAGILHLFVAKNDNERRKILNSIGPVWDGNEVWLLAAGGVLYFAFPKLYAVSFSGFYLPLIIVLWLFMFRGLGIELRHHVNSQLWKSFWDFWFSVSSILLSIFFGAALGNVIRGVPINETGYFFLPLWTNFNDFINPGILDFFTIIFALLAFSTLLLHGANFIMLRTTDEIFQRSKKLANIGWYMVLAFSTIAVFLTNKIRWDLFSKLGSDLIVTAFFFISIVSLILIKIFNNRDQNLKSFLSSSVFIFSMLVVTAFGLYPTVLPSTIKNDFSLTIYNSSTNKYGLEVGVVWWIIGIIFTIIYFIFLYSKIKGKTEIEEGSY